MDLFLKKPINLFRKLKHKRKQLTNEQQLLFMKQLLRLLTDGYSLIQALKVLEWNNTFIDSTKIISKNLTEGKYIDEAFEQANFHHTIIAYLYFVRFNHDLITSLSKAIHMFTTQVENRKKFSNIIRYPLILSFIFIILLFFLKNIILPSFIDLFQYSSDSSTSILFTITIIDFFVTLFIIVCFVVLIGFIGWKYYLRKLPIEDQITYYTKIPIYRSLLKMQTSYFFTTHISMFLKTGMSMKTILKQMIAQNKLPIISHYAVLMEFQLKNGFPLGYLIENFDFIDSQIAFIFEQQQNHERLEQDLHAYSNYVIENMEYKIKKALTLIQPVFFCILASFIIFIYLALMWPMFQLIQTV